MRNKNKARKTFNGDHAAGITEWLASQTEGELETKEELRFNNRASNKALIVGCTLVQEFLTSVQHPASTFDGSMNR